MSENIKDYILKEEKINYVDGLLRSIPYHLSRINALEDKLLDLETYAQQGFSHGKSFNNDTIPQKHHTGNNYEKMMMQYIEKKERLENKIEYEKEQIADVENWLQSLPEQHSRLIKERYFNNLSLDALAFRHGRLAVNTVKYRIRKILLSYPDDGDEILIDL